MNTNHITNKLIAAFDDMHERNLAHAAKIDKLPLPGTSRVCVKSGGYWLESVSYEDGPGWNVKKTSWTQKRIKAGCFLPEVAVAVAKQMSHLNISFEKP